MSTATKILEAAFVRFASQGYEGTSLHEIATDCGIKKSSLYTHYHGKNHLFIQLVKASVYAEMDFAREQMQSAISTTNALKGLLESTLTRFEQSPPLRFWVRATSLPPPCCAEEIKGYVGIYYAGLRSVVVSVLEHGTKASGQRKDLLATAYLGILKGLYASLIQESGEPSARTLSALWTIYQQALERR